MVRVISILLAIEGEHHVIGVQVTGWFKVFIILPLHTLTEVESIGFAIRTDFPFLSKSWNNFRRTGFKFDQAVIDRYGAGIIGGARGEELWVKSFRRAFRTINQGFRLHAGGDGHGDQAQTKLQHP
ncbi:Uncharacterised protein [Klebsiella pneumoniae]|nr:Uncharacterised protein [Klebsiella pneumoniae]SAU28756.1 Uncharacterised protein [Klebsiella pneumoniae]SLO75349.1 Uncharacterised protein [Klebsiella pneumoniae]